MAAVQDVWDKLTQTAVEKKTHHVRCLSNSKSTFLLSGLGQRIRASLGTHVPRPRCNACAAIHQPPATTAEHADGANLRFWLFFFVLSCQQKTSSGTRHKRITFWKVSKMTYRPFSGCTAAKVIMEALRKPSSALTRRDVLVTLPSKCLVRGNLERRSASACGGGDSCRLGRFFACPINDHKESICSNKPRKRTQIRWNCSVISPCRWWISFSQRTACAFYPVYTRVKYVMTYFPTH